MFDQEVSVIVRYLIIMFNVSYYFSSNQEKGDGFCLKITDQIKKFLFKTISKTIFPITRAPGAYSVSKS